MQTTKFKVCRKTALGKKCQPPTPRLTFYKHTWVFRRKRTPHGTISKYKARYCVQGDLQETVQKTFAPVVAWSTVWLFLVLSLILSWKTCTINFSSAFGSSLDPPSLLIPHGRILELPLHSWHVALPLHQDSPRRRVCRQPSCQVLSQRKEKSRLCRQDLIAICTAPAKWV